MSFIEAKWLAHYLRGAAKLHSKSETFVEVSPEFHAAMRSHGVQLDPPMSRNPCEYTPQQANHYADQLERIEREKGAA